MKVPNYSKFISNSIRCKNVAIIRTNRAKVEFGLRFKKYFGLGSPQLEEIYYYFHKMQPSNNEMSEKFHCYVCANFCVFLESEFV